MKKQQQVPIEGIRFGNTCMTSRVVYRTGRWADDNKSYFAISCSKFPDSEKDKRGMFAGTIWSLCDKVYTDNLDVAIAKAIELYGGYKNALIVVKHVYPSVNVKTGNPIHVHERRYARYAR